MKLFLIHIAEYFDVYVLRHRIYWVCQRVGLSEWWGDTECQCRYCTKCRASWAEMDSKVAKENANDKE